MNCGAELKEGTKFCISCGTPVPQQAEQQPQQPVYQQPQQTQQPVYQQPQQQVYSQPVFQQQPVYPQQQQYRQPVYQQPVYGQPVYAGGAAVTKKKGKGGIVFLIILLILAIGAVGYFGFRDGGWFRSKSRPTKYDGISGYEAIIDYANRLEAEGNLEAAAKVRTLIPKAGAGEANQKIEEFKENNEILAMIEGIEDALKIANAMNGGK